MKHSPISTVLFCVTGNENMSKPPPDPLYVIRGNQATAHCFTFDNYEHLLIGTDDGSVHVWDLKTCKKKQVIEVSTHACISVHIVQNFLITQDKHCELKIWLRPEHVQLVHSQRFNNLSFCKIDVFHSESTYLSIPQPNSTINLYIFTDYKFLISTTFKYENPIIKLGEVLHLKFFEIGCKYLAAIYENGMLGIWSLDGYLIMLEKLTSSFDIPMSFDFDTNLKQGVLGTSGKEIIAFRLDQNLKIFKRKRIRIVNEGTASLAIRQDGKILAAGGWDGKIRIFSWSSCKLLAVLDCHSANILHVSFSCSPVSTWDCRNVLIVSSSDKRISFWKIYE